MSDLTKFGNLCSALAAFSFQFDVIVLSEVKIKSTFPVKLYNINGYNQFSSLRTERSGGGLLVFIKQEFAVEETPPTPNKFEKLNLSFKRAEMKMRMLAYYRAPSTNVKDFLEDLESEISSSDIKTFILGDININTKDSANNLRTDHTSLEYIELRQSYGYEV